MATERKTEPKLAEAAAKTTAVLETLKSRLNRDAAAPERVPTEHPDVPDELGRELEQYFAVQSLTSPLANAPASGAAEDQISSEIRSLVINGVVDRILRSWGAPDDEIPANIKSEVIARLVEHVLGALLKKNSAPR